MVEGLRLGVGKRLTVNQVDVKVRQVSMDSGLSYLNLAFSFTNYPKYTFPLEILSCAEACGLRHSVSG